MSRPTKKASSSKIKSPTIPLQFDEPQEVEWKVEETMPQEDHDLTEEAVTDQDENDHDSDEGDETGQQTGSGGGGGVHFEETETDFDATELQGLSLPIFRNALKKGLKLASRLTKQSERYLSHFLPEVGLRSRVIEATLSENGHPTLLLDKGEIVQYQITAGKLERVRVSPDLDAERAVKYAMAGFIAAGESINPKDVKFGRSPEFQARMKPIWIREWNKIQQQKAHDLSLGHNPNRDASFKHTANHVAEVKPLFMGGWQKLTRQPRIDIPRMTTSRTRDPHF
jgi:hypothetical protein